MNERPQRHIILDNDSMHFSSVIMVVLRERFVLDCFVKRRAMNILWENYYCSQR